MTFENAKVIETDFTCSNGVIHVINSVVLPLSGPSAVIKPVPPPTKATEVCSIVYFQFKLRLSLRKLTSVSFTERTVLTFGVE